MLITDFYVQAEKNLTEVENLKSGLGADGEIDPKVATRILKKNAQQPNREAWRIQRNLLTKLPGIKMQRYPQQAGGRPFKKTIWFAFLFMHFDNSFNTW